MSIFKFSAQTSGTHLGFDPDTDTLAFDSAAINAAQVRLSVSGSDLAFSAAGKTVWLDGMDYGLVTIENVAFADGSLLLIGDGTSDRFHDAYGQYYTLTSSTVGNQVWGLGGADLVTTGRGNDWIVGNVALAPLNHVSRDGSTGSPTSSTSATISADGRFVAFAGGWTAFGSTNDNGTDVFVKDMVSGAVSDEHRDAAGVNGLSGSGSPVISADGQHLVFVSSSGLVPGTPPSGTLYMSAVGAPGIQAISTTSGNAAYADRGAYLPDVAGNGRYVVFSSDATNLAAGSTSATVDVFLKDVDTGTVTRLSTSTTGVDGNGDSGYLGNAAYTGAKISADGDYVVFQSAASNLVGGDTNGRTDIFLWSRDTGQLTNLTQGLAVVSNPNNGNVEADVAYNGDENAIVVFQTARNLVAADTSNGTDIYALNFKTGAVQLVSATADGSGVSLSSEDASISDDGRWVVFTSYSDELVAGDTNGTRDIFVKDLYTGQIALVSKSATGAAGNGPSMHAQISSGGDWIVFESSATNLAGTDANGSLSDVFRVANPLLADTLQGGAGNDTYVLNRNDGVIEAAGGGIDTVQASISYTLGANVENLTLTGTGNLAGTGNALDNVITGNAGSNRLNGAGGIDTVSYANATAAVTVDLSLTAAQATGFGSDTLLNFENAIGSRFNDKLTGNALDNRLDGGAGGDTLSGGAGNDTYVVDAATDIIVEVSGTDSVISSVNWTLQPSLENLTLIGTTAIIGNGNSTANVLVGNAANNLMNGGAGNDTITGGAGNDSLTGSTGDDRLVGGVGNDTLVGGEGSDTYVVDSAADIISETGTTAGNIDSVISSVDWTLQGSLENLTLTGTTAVRCNGNSVANLLTGNATGNTIDAGAGNDTVSGGAGNDTITGGLGNDSLTGGVGSDVFRFTTTSGSDTITDFVSGADRLAFSQAGLKIGDGDLLVEGGVLRGAPGGFSASAELVIFTGNAASLSTADAAAAIGSASSAYAADRTALFVVDNGSSTGVFLFHSADGNAAVSAAELTLLATLGGTPATALADYAFVS